MLMAKTDCAERSLIDVARIDTRVPPYIRIINGSLDEDPTSPAGIILFGRVDPATFRFLKVGDYQRHVSERDDIFEAIQKGQVPPPIDIGVRGQDFISDGADFLIRSEAYVIDGLQRVGNAERVLDMIPNMGVRLFALVHFNTTKEWERKRFEDLQHVIRVSPDLHLNNLRHENPAVLTLFGLSNNTREFALYKRISWSQSMQRGDLLKASILAKTTLRLHAHQTTALSNTVDATANGLKRAMENVSMPTFRRNVSTFFSVINECWPFAAIEYRRKATQLKGSFLGEIARMFSNHPIFWDETDRILVVSADDRRKLGKFPIHDPHVSNLAGASGKARDIMNKMLVDHMNSGRRDRRLVER